MRVVAIVVVMACAAAPPVVVTNRATDGHGPPSLFAPLFREGASWKLAAQTKITDDSGHQEMRAGVVTCSIQHVRVIPGRWTAELDCAGIETDQPIHVTIVATDVGLWHFDHTAIELAPDTMAIAAQPQDGMHHERDLGSGAIEAYSVTRVGDHWCLTYNTTEGDDRAWMLCIGEHAGIVGGSSYFLGGQTKLTTFGDVPEGP